MFFGEELFQVDYHFKLIFKQLHYFSSVAHQNIILKKNPQHFYLFN